MARAKARCFGFSQVTGLRRGRDRPTSLISPRHLVQRCGAHRTRPAHARQPATHCMPILRAPPFAWDPVRGPTWMTLHDADGRLLAALTMKSADHRGRRSSPFRITPWARLRWLISPDSTGPQSTDVYLKAGCRSASIRHRRVTATLIGALRLDYSKLDATLAACAAQPSSTRSGDPSPSVISHIADIL
jgi:hypothetical protein